MFVEFALREAQFVAQVAATAQGALPLGGEPLLFPGTVIDRFEIVPDPHDPPRLLTATDEVPAHLIPSVGLTQPIQTPGPATTSVSKRPIIVVLPLRIHVVPRSKLADANTAGRTERHYCAGLA